jgi:hypothetical protein
MPCAVASYADSSVVDIFNVGAGTWSTARLSLGGARSYLVATSLPEAVIFAGGQCKSCDGLFGV